MLYGYTYIIFLPCFELEKKCNLSRLTLKRLISLSLYRMYRLPEHHENYYGRKMKRI